MGQTPTDSLLAGTAEGNTTHTHVLWRGENNDTMVRALIGAVLDYLDFPLANRPDEFARLTHIGPTAVWIDDDLVFGHGSYHLVNTYGDRLSPDRSCHGQLSLASQSPRTLAGFIQCEL